MELANISAPAPQMMGMSTGGRGQPNALLALKDAGLLCNEYKVQGYEDLMEKARVVVGTSSLFGSFCCQAWTCGGCCGNIYQFFEVEEGAIQAVTAGDGSDQWYGRGVHIAWSIGMRPGRMNKVTSSEVIENGTKGVVTIPQGYVGLIRRQGQVLVLGPGLHSWHDADCAWKGLVDLNSNCIRLGPYTLLIVEEGFAAITQDNGKQDIKLGGTAHMLTHQNHKFQGWLSLKMQTEALGTDPQRPVQITTADNITLIVKAVVTWYVQDPQTAAAINVDLQLGNDPLALMRQDVILQVTSSLAALIGRVKFGATGSEGLAKAAATGEVDESADKKVSEEAPTRKALWDPTFMTDAVSDANLICEGYGAKVLSITIQTAEPEDRELGRILQQNAISSVSVEETLKEAKANADALLTKVRSEVRQTQAQAKAAKIDAVSKQKTLTIEAEGAANRSAAQAEALVIKARADAQAITMRAAAQAEGEKLKALGAKFAGSAIAESKVATALEKLKIAYAPFLDKKSQAYFFGIDGPGEMPEAILGKNMADDIKVQ